MRGDEPAEITDAPGRLDEFPTCVGMNRSTRALRRKTLEFPTCVGMNRDHDTAEHAVDRVPHMRGDEPVINGRTVRNSREFPTCVGMNRHVALRENRGSSPHAWG